MREAALGAVATLVLAAGGGGAPADRADAPGAARAGSGWTRVWSDGFAGRGPARTSRWLYDTGMSYPGGERGWGNHELERYTTSTENVSRDGHGHLAIRAVRAADGTWTSGRIETRRTDFRPPAGGSVAVSARIRLPHGGRGYWPAFWLLGAPFRGNLNLWPDAGEIDVMENVDGTPEVSGSLHCGRSEHDGPCREPDGLSAERTLAHPGRFHTYGVVWNTGPRRISWYVDGRRLMTVPESRIGAPVWRRTFDHGFFILLNVAVGGDWPRVPDATTRSGRSMLVDDVRVASNASPDAAPPAG